MQFFASWRMVVLFCAACLSGAFGTIAAQNPFPVADVGVDLGIPAGKILTIDQDGDGDRDWIVANGTSSFSSLNVVMNNGASSVTLGAPIPLNFPCTKYAVGDVDADGDDDIVAADALQFEVKVRQGTAIISSSTYSLGGSGEIRIMDLDGDGHVDIMRGVTQVRYGTGGGNFGAATTIPVGTSTSINPNLSVVEFADLDQDGDQDFVTIGFATGSTNRIGWFRYVAGAFQFVSRTIVARSPTSTGPEFENIALGDFDGDGDQDCIVEESGNSRFLREMIFDNGVFVHRATFSYVGNGATSTYNGFLIANIDGDQDDDVVVFDDTGDPFFYVTDVYLLLGSPAALVDGALSFSIVGEHIHDRTAVGVSGSANLDLAYFRKPLVGTSATFAVRQNQLGATTYLPSIVLLAASGDNQAIDYGDSFQPLVVRVVDGGFGMPVAGRTVNFYSPPISGLAPANDQGLAASPVSVMTDANGYAQTNLQVTASPTVVLSQNAYYPALGGPRTVTAATLGAPGVFFTVTIARALQVVRVLNASAIYLDLFYPDGGAPLLITADLPLPAPGYVATPYGKLYSSILSPSGNLVVLDGWGLLGPPNPALVTFTPVYGNFAFELTGTIPPGAFAGLTYVFQMAVYAVPFPQAIYLSNPAVVTF